MAYNTFRKIIFRDHLFVGWDILFLDLNNFILFLGLINLCSHLLLVFNVAILNYFVLDFNLRSLIFLIIPKNFTYNLNLLVSWQLLFHLSDDQGLDHFKRMLVINVFAEASFTQATEDSEVNSWPIEIIFNTRFGQAKLLTSVIKLLTEFQLFFSFKLWTVRCILLDEIIKHL